VAPAAAGYRVATNRGEWRCRTVVLASGAFNVPVLPAASAAVPAFVQQITPDRYRCPAGLPEGGVLMVGASATGVQLADEIQRSGRPVTLAVGEHVRMPRSYRGRDVQWWMDRTGLLDERHDAVDDLNRVRRVPSPQLVGNPQRNTLDLNTLAGRGVRLVGRFAGVHGSRALFSGSLRNTCALADLKQGRLLDTFDGWARTAEADGYLPPPERFAPTRLPADPRLSIDLAGGELRTIIWATGFRPDYRWLHVPVLDHKGRLRHHGGVVDAPG
jgi:putative flavoprotein involved in K+ transport